MRTFDYIRLADQTWDMDILNLVAKIHEYKGRQDLYIRQKPVELERLVQRLQINRTIYLPKFPSASLSSVGVATATPPSSALQHENLFCVYSPIIWKTLY